MLTKRVMVLLGALIGGFILSVVPLTLARSSLARHECPQVNARLEDDEDNCSPDQPMIQTQASIPLIATSNVITGFELFVGTGENGPPSNNPFLIDVATNLSETALLSVSVSGATYDPFGERVLFTSNSADEFESDLWQWVPGTITPTLLGVIRTPDGDLAIDGLAMAKGLLFGAHQLSSSAGEAGLYEISLNAMVNTDTIQASQVLTWSTGDRSINGLDADPRNGRIYAADDSQMELVEISLDGTITPVIPYLSAAETDLDGLAIGDNGLAYLVPDDPNPGSIYVYDLDDGIYVDLIRSPWTGEDSASAGAFQYPLPPPPTSDGILTKTVGTDPNICASTHDFSLPIGTEATYCYRFTNTGDITLTEHTLVDSQLGTILGGFNLRLGPGASVWLTQTANVGITTVNTATWIASSPGTRYTDPLADNFSVPLSEIPTDELVSPLEISPISPQGGVIAPDLTELLAGFDDTNLILTMSFATSISPADSGLPDALIGLVELDIDQNINSGARGLLRFICNLPPILGVDYTVDLSLYDNGLAPIQDRFGLTNPFSATVTFDSPQVTIQIPLNDLRVTGPIDLYAGFGSPGDFTDCAPNAGLISTSPAGTAVVDWEQPVIFVPVVKKD